MYCPGRWKIQISGGTFLVNLPVTSCPSGVVSSYASYVHKCLVLCYRCLPQVPEFNFTFFERSPVLGDKLLGIRVNLSPKRDCGSKGVKTRSTIEEHNSICWVEMFLSDGDSQVRSYCTQHQPFPINQGCVRYGTGTPGTGMDAVPSLPKCPVPVLMS